MQTEQLRQDYLRGFEEVRIEVVRLIHKLSRHNDIEVKIDTESCKVVFSNRDHYVLHEGIFELLVNRKHMTFMTSEYDNLEAKIELAKLKHRLEHLLNSTMRTTQ